MHLQKIAIKNFRLLKDVELFFEPKTTVVVGRNNSGKTSLTELFRRLLGDRRPTFRLEDFSTAAHQGFWNAFLLKCEGREEADVRGALPRIEINLTVSYASDSDFGQLSEFIIDLNPDCTEALIEIKYELRDGEVDSFFGDLECVDVEEQRASFYKSLSDRVKKSYTSNVRAVDPNDPTNDKPIEWSQLHALVQTGFIHAQRGLDDTTDKDIDFLGVILERLLQSAMSELADPKDQQTAQLLQKAVQEMQEGLDSGFNKQLKELFPAFSLFGYPGLTDPRLLTQTTLDIQRLLKNHTRVQYEGSGGINFPETYNGLGVRNLIYILLRLLEFFKNFRTATPAPSFCLIFIEEPEVHLHPQMQEVFIAELGRIADVLAAQFNSSWPVQFIVTTHSSHLANRANFDGIRYFKATPSVSGSGFVTVIKDLHQGLSASGTDREFLHKYMTLTRCDLLFADKAALIEGTSERLLLPIMIQKVDEEDSTDIKLSTQYISIVEVGGAYAHLFFDLVTFLELPTLIITDLDSIDATTRKACKVSAGAYTSNACITSWFSDSNIDLNSIGNKVEIDRVKGSCRLAYQIPESEGACCARSLEGAFMLANPNLFDLDGMSEEQKETEVWENTNQIGRKKTEFALRYAIEETDWKVPRYVGEGLRWLRDVQTRADLGESASGESASGESASDESASGESASDESASGESASGESASETDERR